ncbi:hypothetical protein BJ741DRAFT_376654 [Chytriomyces cf. hyalinus JEL632]|nr:hypothetical protein BJ741DRAFT_376654 [Chytriomyces cf. hyalinus JEL632]
MHRESLHPCGNLFGSLSLFVFFVHLSHRGVHFNFSFSFWFSPRQLFFLFFSAFFVLMFNSEKMHAMLLVGGCVLDCK